MTTALVAFWGRSTERIYLAKMSMRLEIVVEEDSEEEAEIVNTIQKFPK